MRVVVRTPNWLGDIVMALPVLAALRAHFPEAVLAAAVPRPLAPMLSAVAEVDQVVGLTRNRRGRRRLDAEIETLRSGAFDLALLLPNSFGAAWVARRAAIPERWGFASQWRRQLLTRAVTLPRRRLPVLHQSALYQELLRGLSIEPVAPEPRLEVPGRMIRLARTLLDVAGCNQDRPIVGVAPGAAYGHAKRWPPDRYARVAARLSGEFGASVVLLGSSHDRDAGYTIESVLAATCEAEIRRRVVNLIGRTDLSELIGLLACCRVLVSSDSGAMHLAAAVGVPVTAIFGPTDDRLTAPVGPHTVLTNPVWCRPCFFRDCPIDHRCMAQISEERVFQAVARQLVSSTEAQPPSN